VETRAITGGLASFRQSKTSGGKLTSPMFHRTKPPYKLLQALPEPNLQTHSH
jgi:hypothetical protein